MYSFRPDGQAPVAKRDIATTAACNKCHTRLEAHGGARREVGLCVMCHTNTADLDPDTGNTFDFKIMIHNIHRGAGLPSVDAGTPYRFIGFGNALHDYSQVQYPGFITQCEACHTGSQGDRWKTNPSREGCQGCHDRTWFTADAGVPAGYHLHPGGPREDSQCIVCHADNSIEPVSVRHRYFGRDSKTLDVTSVIGAMPQVAPLTRPAVTFTMNVNGQARDVLAQRLSRLRFVFAGPNTDVARFYSETAENAPDCATVTDGGACLERVDAGVFVWRSATPLLATDQGSFTVGIEACAFNDAGTRFCAINPTRAFAVTDPAPVPRRTSVTLAQCNNCHQRLSEHGGTRNNTQHCTVCHGANLTQNVVVPGDGGVVVSLAADFKHLIHQAHSQVEYPSPLNSCQACHTGQSFVPPLSAGVLPTRFDLRQCGNNPDGGSSNANDAGVCFAAAVVSTPQYIAPTTSACTSCHGSLAAQAHAMVNTTSQGVEACAVCHAAARSSATDAVHALTP